jgi:vancomycin resistance protein YoaR
VKNFVYKTLFIFPFILLSCILTILSSLNFAKVYAFPFYDLCPKELTLRSEFITYFRSSSLERKNNIKVATRSLNKTFVDVFGEFSFNKTVGPRTESRGYKNSKIIVGGQFVEGVGGGVCQVSTTLYNALILSGLNVTEFHPHSLPVSYVSPSFDAMVSFGFADLKFVNDTHNPIIIYAFATDEYVKIQIYGEPLEFSYERQSVVVEQIPAPKEKEIEDDKGEYPELLIGQKQVLKYSTPGLKSEGYLLKYKNGKKVGVKKLRHDKYNATQGIVILGTALPPLEDLTLPNEPIPTI